ncbi:2-acylglycerol O-acyltransferase 2-A-like [Phymastichus coffea]|uniref:2-acylglycerol O-acyltransferase 2-A-like n=1 Tax=Phymastichus coffea TaxID=108790 RepID=UPI00273BD790|nr:2-acylglycerol O-acyltransferase 2-A-like [Phymastichus coffea]
MTKCNENLTSSTSEFDKKLQSICFVATLYTFICVFVCSCVFSVSVLFLGSRWVKAFFVIYLIYFYYDSDAHWRGGRSGKWTEKLRNLKIWKHCANYFPVKLIKTTDLDPSSNYILCGFPHGLFAFGFASAFGANCTNCDDMFPGLEFRILSLRLFFYVPFFRELALIFGGCSCSKESMQYLLSTKPQTQKQSRALILLVGGSDDAFRTRRGVYRIVLKNRKGFIRTALKNGTPLVPVFSFGEVDYYDIFHPKEGTLLHKIKNFSIKKFGLFPSIVIRGNILKNFFSFKPIRTPIHVVVGSPIKVPKIENPIEEEVDEYHKIFIEKLIELFDSYKSTYMQIYNCGNITLNLV